MSLALLHQRRWAVWYRYVCCNGFGKGTFGCHGAMNMEQLHVKLPPLLPSSSIACHPWIGRSWVPVPCRYFLWDAIFYMQRRQIGVRSPHQPGTFFWTPIRAGRPEIASSNHMAQVHVLLYRKTCRRLSQLNAARSCSSFGLILRKRHQLRIHAKATKNTLN